MPELPEVEVVCRSLRQTLVGRRIVDFRVTLPKLLKLPSGDEAAFAAGLGGQTVTAITRRGKYIHLVLDNAQILTVHLRMTGKLLYLPARTPLGKHSHIVMALDNAYELRFDDVRQFGAFYLTSADELDQISGLAALGIEPLSAEFTPEVLAALIKGRTQKAKAFLLDQQYIAGIGNIYADEILFQAQIYPAEPIGHITAEDDIVKLWQAIVQQLEGGIAAGGSSIKDYVDSLGQSGHYQEQHRVYGRAGMPCVDCGTTIAKMKLAGRSTCYCPNCQTIHNR